MFVHCLVISGEHEMYKLGVLGVYSVLCGDIKWGSSRGRYDASAACLEMRSTCKMRRLVRESLPRLVTRGIGYL